ncbi:hypothetical protein PCANC_16009 [Puccinia coronata f. sp. avenae]|uniref:Transcription factor domain-containing protein n=1 Tax=Puccinia coronata f. sp. avenae TaxID=200324 RepID=A0A2N5VRZ1_9BASI|nr:hypothetical protein PCANC_16009 [Puccinia coronata f. sp. avenae]
MTHSQGPDTRVPGECSLSLKNPGGPNGPPQLEQGSFGFLPSSSLPEWPSSGTSSTSGVYAPSFIDQDPSRSMMMAGISGELPKLSPIEPLESIMDRSNIYLGTSEASTACVLNSNLLEPRLFRLEENCNEFPHVTSISGAMVCKPAELVPTSIVPDVSHPSSTILLHRTSKSRPIISKLYHHPLETALNSTSLDSHCDDTGASKKCTNNTITTTITTPVTTQSHHEPTELHNFENSALQIGAMQQSRPNPVTSLDDLDIRGERLKERVNSSYSQAHELQRSLDRLEPQLQYLRQASWLTGNQHPIGSVANSMVPPASESFRHEALPPITPKNRPKLPSRTVKGYPLQKLPPDYDPTVPRAVAPVGLNPTSAQIINWPRRGDAAHRLSFILNPTMNPAKENKRDLESPSPGSDNSQDADNFSSDVSKRQTIGISESFSTVSIPGSGAAAGIRLTNEGTGKLDPVLVQLHRDLFFKRYSNRLTWFSAESESVETLQRKSDLLLCAIISASDPKKLKSEIPSSCYQHALNTSRSTVFPEKNYNIHDVKGIMVLAIYHGLHCVCPHFVSLCMDLKLHKVFVKLTDRNIRGGATEEELVEMGRTWLLVVIYSHILCIFSRKLYLIGSPAQMIYDHAKTLGRSSFKQDCDSLINAHVNLVMVLALAQDKLDSRNHPGSLRERKEEHVLPELYIVINHLDRWAMDWKQDCPQLFTTKAMGPRRFLQNAQPYIRLYIMHAAVWPCHDGRMIIANQRQYQWASEACQHAENILEAVLDLKDEIDARGEDDSELYPNDLPLNIEYHKATFGLVTGYLLWSSLIIPRYVKLNYYVALFKRLHGIKFKDSCEYIEIIEKCIFSIHEILELENETVKSEQLLHHGLGLPGQVYKIGTNLQAKGCQLGPNELEDGCVGEYRSEDGTFRMGEDMTKELDKLMTDTQFWFQLELE